MKRSHWEEGGDWLRKWTSRRTEEMRKQQEVLARDHLQVISSIHRCRDRLLAATCWSDIGTAARVRGWIQHIVYMGEKKIFMDRQYRRELRGILADHFSTQSPNLFRSFSERRTDSGLAEITSCSWNQFSAAVFTSLSEKKIVPDKWIRVRSNLVTPDFPLELSQQFLNFASSMGIMRQEEDGAITQHARASASDNFTMTQ
ncbi:hypothetical protein AVEN_59395-1 [Araneus ventricosus]|uniref:Uncharacterized protein n=1 Tax=Araneus ventricosus TaxID=182803 RepID=A0A4Y2LL15_ARAVE|nr:hypothetical protein AVEN_59395-1 [Araneus ventricosus]